MTAWWNKRSICPESDTQGRENGQKLHVLWKLTVMRAPRPRKMPAADARVGWNMPTARAGLVSADGCCFCLIRRPIGLKRWNAMFVSRSAATERAARQRIHGTDARSRAS